MKIVNENPPHNLRETIKSFGMDAHDNVIYTYGDAIYNPGSHNIPDYLVEHEKTHSEQQGSKPDTWWDRYLQDPYFRIEQESQAYAKQFAFICKRVNDRNKRARILHELASVLSGPVYGKVIGHTAAMKLIKEKSNVKP